MKKSTLHLHSRFTVDVVDPRIFGGFLEHLGRAVYEGVYDPSSQHADDMGCRTDVLDALRRLRFTAMRYPGGNFVSGYHWMDAVGPRESRPRTRDLAWQSIETNQFGPNEFLELSKRMGWTPMMAVNLGTGTPEEARNWLEYCNIDEGTKYADLRREHGYEQPFDVKLWCLGNEMDGPWQIGHVPAETYAINAQQTANMMRMCDPNIELVVCGSCAIDLPTYLEWDRKVLEHCRDYVDYISVHRYVENHEHDTPNFLAVTNSIDDQIEATAAVCHAVQKTKKTKKRIGLSFDEWNVWYRARSGDHLDGRAKVAPPLLEEVYNLEDALIAAGFLNSFIRHADTVKIANIAQIVNVIAPLLTRGDDLVFQTIFYPIEMMAKRREGVSLQVRVEGDGYESKKYGYVNTLDTSAILNRNELSVFLTNRDVSQPLEVTVDLSDRAVTKLLNAEIVHGTDPRAENTFDNPNQITAVDFAEVSIANGKATVKLPPLSFCAATFAV
ncbi:MAG: alpha-N-arabinofuranosidase [Armatimonadetes bacterium]|nr:alpha-N-arabinofuranosidase [Armatimonadota bacterium]MBS1727768.1 alpha-N-arabinofuranosidase [Armatimonadota bacterium]